MSNAVIARKDGDDYQAYFFWLQACQLFYDTGVKKVGFEDDAYKSFDDIAVFHDTPELDAFGQSVEADYYQVKYRVVQGEHITYENLTKPSLIGAKEYSILERLYKAYQQSIENRRNNRFHLVTSQRIDPNDPLSKLISNREGEIRLDRLFAGGPKSRMGKIYTCWMKHLGINKEELEALLRFFRIQDNAGSLDDMRKKLNAFLSSAGLQPVRNDKLTHPYISLIDSLLKRQQKCFTKEELQKFCVHQGLWRGFNPEPPTVKVGIRSFDQRPGNMEDETDEIIDFKQHFNGRHIKDPRSWSEHIYPELKRKLFSFKKGERYDLHMETHLSIAFSAGYILHSKTGIDVAPVQYGVSWRWNPSKEDRDDPALTAEKSDIIDSSSKDVALAIGITMDITDDVRMYLDRANIPVRRLFSFRVGDRNSGHAVKDGTHAKRLAEEMREIIRRRTSEEREGQLHFFYAGPIALMFYLGQEAIRFGSCKLYEYDFNNQLPSAYQPSLSFPPASRPDQ
ncbi:SAVED domain-containing protein [Paludifilum halophilum]|uniref:SAVED domain-containing protein n=1 Tax=Paludifilum halophilum TaxID=1642702 RepID=UPI00146EE78E|nr:SAVED domain-containing protein [Paludifilum halophilum]